jgi:hypothetical protein
LADEAAELNMPQPIETHRTTPVAFFSYHRAEHAGRALDSLARCHRLDECRIYLYCDGAKGDHDRAAVEKSRQVVRAWASKYQAEMIERPDNLGLSQSIVAGVTDLCRTYGRVIVVEDDLVLSPYFIDFMLQALERYQEELKVYQISGYMFPVECSTSTDALFLPLTTTWGWATWARAWQHFDWKAAGAREQLTDPKARDRFDLGGSYPYSKMLEDRLAGKNDSWGILWWWAVFKSNGVVLYPRESLVVNEGFDGSGVHCGPRNHIGGRARVSFPGAPRRPIIFPSRIMAEGAALMKISGLLSAQHPSGRSFGGWVWDVLAKYFM